MHTSRKLTFANFFALFLKNPAQIIALSFFTAIMVATSILMLPAAAHGTPLSFIDALFTITSGTCVTGLAVFDIGTRLTLFGQAVLLTCIQLGGIGITTFSTLVLLLAGKRPDVMNNFVIKDTFAHNPEKNITQILKEVFIITLIIECIGAAILFIQFSTQFAWPEAVYHSFFHSIAAFCNAGFSTFSDSLVSYKDNWLVNLTIIGLIITGGLGYLVITEILRKFTHRRRGIYPHFSLHSKLILSGTLILLTVGTLAIFFLEYDNTLAGMPLPTKILASVFQSVTTRTAGFNTLNIGSMLNATLFVMIVLMFIGAGPGSCAGGIKITAFATLFIAGISKMRGKQQPQIFQRAISPTSIERATALFILAISVLFIGTMALLINGLTSISADSPALRGKFLEMLFETTSAFGTVGLSTGITTQLSSFGKIVITFVMFVGRIGPLTFIAALSKPILKNYRYPQEMIMIG